MNILVHLTISGIIALQPITDRPNHWRVVVPDLSESSHPHGAFLLVETAALVPQVTAAEKYTIYQLKEKQLKLTGMEAVGTSHFPPEMITYHEAAGLSSGPATKLKSRAEFTPQPDDPPGTRQLALELFLDEAGLEATFGTASPWYFERAKDGTILKSTPRLIAEEVCLQFIAPGPTLKLFSGSDQIELAPINGRIEIRLGNIVYGDASMPSVDPHFDMYYGLTKATVAEAERAILKTDETPRLGVPTAHDHTMSQVVIDLSTLRNGWPETAIAKRPRAVTTDAHAHHQRGTVSPRSVTGANCPPIGSGGYP